MPLVSLKEFAKAIGKSPAWITKIKEHGALNTALVLQKGKKRVLIDLDRGLELLQKNVTSGEKETSPEIVSDNDKSKSQLGSYSEARTWSERYKAANQKLNFEIRQGQWVAKAVVKDQAFKAGRIFRDQIFNIGPRLAAILAAETDEMKILKLLQKEFTDAFNELVRALGAIE